MAPGDQHRTSSMRSTIVFSLSVGAVIILGMLAVALTVTWIVKYFGGFAWDGTAREFNYHPLCMVISMVFLYSEGKFLCSLTEALLPLCLMSVDYIMKVFVLCFALAIYFEVLLSSYVNLFPLLAMSQLSLWLWLDC